MANSLLRFGSTAVALVVVLHNLAVHPVCSQGNLAYLTCLGDTNYTAGSQFKSNLDRLLTELEAVPSSAGKGYYGNASVGVGSPDAAYGHLQCRGDIDAADCAICANRSASTAAARCPFRRGVALIFDNCIFRYSDTFFFGAADTAAISIFYNRNNASSPALFDEQVMDLMTDLVSLAPGASSRFAVGIRNFSLDFVNIYGLVLCTRDLSAPSCDGCLRYLLQNLVRHGSVGGQVYVASCTLGYEIRPYFSLSTVPPPPSPVRPAEGPTSSGTSNVTDGGLSSQGTKSKPSRVLIILGVVVGSVVVLFATVFYFLRRTRGKSVMDEVADIPSESLHFELRALKLATGNFGEENKLGQGGFGPVYKGVLPDGRQIAVKRLSRGSGQGETELRNEVLLLAKLHHRNLTKLLGFCTEENEKIVVYEYLPNQSLDKILFDPIKSLTLNWEKRLKLIEGIARGLVYLHEDSRLRIIHRDLKASNILLDEQMNPKISDFGLAKFFGIEESHGNTSQIAGTYGYMAPEYVFHGQFSVKSDVFSFGVLMLEVITGRQNSGFRETEDTVDLLSYVWNYWTQGEVLQVVDRKISKDCQANEVARCIHISLLCVQNDPAARPNISDVALMLSSFSVSLRRPSKPAFHISGSEYALPYWGEDSGVPDIHGGWSRHGENENSVSEIESR